MSFCPGCGARLGDGDRFCAGCGRPAAADPDATRPSGSPSDPDATQPTPRPGDDRTAPSPPPASRRPVSSRAPISSAPSSEDGVYAPGALIADRYRIVGLLGKGGMGEVYRADDLTLGQSVALKFLPDSVAGNADRRQRFHAEVRTAREVSHPNVCRVYDIGDVDGRVYLSMEYIDGEDLSSLLRRIGRLPQEKAVEMARQLCAGLAALHDRGLLHRDLKPANVMVDGRGRVRLTDFGLAGLASEMKGAEVRAGTPAYMAPEQLAGEHVDQKSDLYALGLVLYEMFTGRRAFEAETIAELSKLHRESTAPSASTILPDLDPAVERILERCLDRDPDRRPSSAIAVAAALPGGDPLAAALAAGEIPSIELVASTGETGRVRPLIGVLGIVCAIVGLLVAGLVNQRERLWQWDPLEKSPQVLEDRARDLLAQSGWPEGRYESHGWSLHGEALRWMAARDSSAVRWEPARELDPPAVMFWYRRSPEALIPWSDQRTRSRIDPPATVAGMSWVLLDSRGRLRELRGVPSRDVEAAPEESTPCDWTPLLEAAGFDPATLEPAEPSAYPWRFSDEQAAWVRPPVGEDDPQWRVEGFALHGRPVEFRVLGPWSQVPGEPQGRNEGGALAVELLLILLLLAILGAGVTLAVRNVKLGRGDRAGARRLSLFVGGSSFVVWLMEGQHTSSPSGEINYFFSFVGQVLTVMALFLMLYLALEPYVRRTWPDRIVSWSRLLTGRWRDPLIGRDIVMGAIFFLAFALLDAARVLGRDALGIPPASPKLPDADVLLGTSALIGELFSQIVNSSFNAMFFLLLLLFLRIVFRRPKVAIVAYVALFGFFVTFQGGSGDFGSMDRILVAATGLTLGVLFLVAMLRFGLLAFMVAFFFDQIGSVFPVTLDFSNWYSGASITAIVAVLGLTVYGFWIGVSGRGLLQSALDDQSR